VCRRLLGDEQDALDATQETMIAIARGITTFDARSSFSTWAYRIATNASLDELRRRRRRPATETKEPEPALRDRSLMQAGHARADQVGDTVSARVTLDQALKLVSEEHRTAVVLRDMLDLEYAEIAEVLRVPVGTVRSRIARGRAALAQALDFQAAQPDPVGNATEVSSVQVDTQ
jgi:RNA polymerase sigma-70 factor (ECF subfamily)